MLTRLDIESEALFCLGDIHGEFGGIHAWISRYDLQNACLIFCGDIGFGFVSPEYYKQVFAKLNRECKRRNVTLLFLRGNHDDPSYFAEQKIKLSHIRTIPDYTVLTTAGHVVLCVGGAISIDRTVRQAKMLQDAAKYARFHDCSISEAKQHAPKCYWEDEMPVYDAEAMDAIRDAGIRIDTVCTHTAPSFAEPNTKDGLVYWLAQDATLDEDTRLERETMDRLWERLRLDGHPVQSWFYGHYHYHHAEEHDGVMFRMLDMCRNSCFYDMVEVK